MYKLWNKADKDAVAAPAAYKATYAFINGLFGTKSVMEARYRYRQMRSHRYAAKEPLVEYPYILL